MDKKTPNKRKSVANTNTTPKKIQKIAATPVSQKKNKPPANKNQKTPQKKQQNGKQNTPKEKKKAKEIEDDETELMSESDDEIETAEDEENNESGSDERDSDEEENDDASDEENGDVSDEEKKVEDKKKQESDRKFSVYVSALDYSFTETELESIFDDTNILSAIILRNPKSNKSKGCGFVNFKDKASVEKALKKDGTEINGRNIKVNLPRKKDNRTDAKSKKPNVGGAKNKSQKPHFNANKKNQNGKFNKKNNANKNKKAVKQE